MILLNSTSQWNTFQGKNHTNALSHLNNITSNTLTAPYSLHTTTSRQYHGTLRAEYFGDPYFIPIFNWLVNHKPLIKDYRTIIKHYTCYDDIIYYQNNLSSRYRVTFPLDSIRTLLLQPHHDSNLAGYPGTCETFQSLLRDYYWPCTIVTIRHYIRFYVNCQKIRNIYNYFLLVHLHF